MTLFIGLDGTAFIRHVHAALLATNVAARREPGYERRVDWTRAAASSSSSLSGHCSSSFQQSSRCRLAAATDPNPRGRVTLRTIRRPGHVPSFDASGGNSVARQRLAIDTRARIHWRVASVGIVRVDRGRWAHIASNIATTARQRPVKRRTAWVHCSMKSTLAASRTVCARDCSIVNSAGLPSPADLRRRRKEVYSLLAPDVHQPACIQCRAVSGQRLGTPSTTRPARARSLLHGCEGDRRGAHERDDQAARQ